MIISNCSHLSNGSNVKVIVKCDFCGNEVLKRYADAIRQPHHFCNHDCSHKYQRKIAIDNLNQKLGCSFKDWLYQKYIVEMLPTKNIANELGFSSHQAIVDWLRVFEIPVRTWGESRTGKLSPNYNPNLTDEERRKQRDTKEDVWFKQGVFKRDNYTCQKCGKHGGLLNAHHLQNYADFLSLRYDVNNGITFCDNCHKTFHKKYGYRHTTNKQVIQYLSE